MSKPELRASPYTPAFVLGISSCLLVVSTGFYYFYPIGIHIESILLCVLPHIMASLSYMICTARSFSFESVIPFVSGAAWTVMLSCVITLGQIDPILDSLLVEGSVAYTLVFSFLRAAVVEEAVKLFVALDTPVKADVYFSGFTGALGFAAAENLQYYLLKDATLWQIVARLITANVLHVACTYLILLIGFRLRTRGNWLLAFSLGVLFHGLFDFLVLSGIPVAALAVVEILIVVVASLTMLSDDYEMVGEDEDHSLVKVTHAL